MGNSQHLPVAIIGLPIGERVIGRSLSPEPIQESLGPRHTGIIPDGVVFWWTYEKLEEP
jgi:hypothetical protein